MRDRNARKQTAAAFERLRTAKGWLSPWVDGVYTPRAGIAYLGSPGGRGVCAVLHTSANDGGPVSPGGKYGVGMTESEMLAWIESEIAKPAA